MPNGKGWNIMVRCDIHNHDLDKDLIGHDILDHLKPDERLIVNEMTEHYMV